MEKLLLIDGNSLINRAFYAMPLLVTKNGTYTNAVYGFMNMFFKMLSSAKPTHVCVAFDRKEPTFRHEMYKEYKGTRKPMPEELRPQIDMLKEVLALSGVKTIEKAGIEADDIIGTLCKCTNMPTIIVTGDRDSFQLVDNSTSVYFTKRGITETDVYSIDNFEEKTGIKPIQIIELKALMGDSSDNIPGVAGIGEKTANSLIKDYGDIDNIYAHINDFKGKLKEKLEQGKDMAYLSKTLATINVNCDICTNIEEMKVPTIFSQKLKEKFIELEFKSLFSKDSLFEKAKEQQNVLKDQKEIVKKSFLEISEQLIQELKDCKEYTLTIFGDYINLFANGTEYEIKLRKNLLDDGVSLGDATRDLAFIFEKDKKLIVYDKKALMHLLKQSLDIKIEAKFEDVMVIKYLTDFSPSEKTVLDMLLLFGYEKVLASSLYSIYNILKEKMVELGVVDLYYNIELPLIDILFDMEVSGFKVDKNALAETSKKYSALLLDIETKIRDLANEPSLNVNSVKQLGEVLFDKLKIGKAKKTKTGYSTSADVLENLVDAHPIVGLILQHRFMQKLQSTYVEGFRPLIDNDGLIHTSFNQTTTATGRLSSREPNLQNIPVREEEGRELRKFFVPKQEGYIVSADYSQIELRLLADFSKCKGLIEAFNKGEDIHTSTASKVFEVPLSEVTPSMRRSAKAVNFGIIYGISEYGLAKNLGISPSKAREYIDAYFKTYPEVKEYMRKNVEFARTNGYVKTYYNRRRYIREISSSSYNLRQFGERAAMNMPLQGSSADIIKVAMIKVFERLKKEGLRSKLILQVHDELIVDTALGEEKEVEKILKEEMEGACNLSVPLTIDVGIGKTWFEAK